MRRDHYYCECSNWHCHIVIKISDADYTALPKGDHVIARGCQTPLDRNRWIKVAQHATYNVMRLTA